MSGGPYGIFQTGCEASRLERLKELGKAKLQTPTELGEKPLAYEITQFCNMYRTEEWKTDKEGDYCQAAKEEVQPTFGIVIQDFEDSTREELEKSVESILACDYDMSKLSVVISTVPSRNITTTVTLVNQLKEQISNSHGVTHLTQSSRIRDKECFQKIVGSSYFVKIGAGGVVSASWFSEIAISLNEDLEQITLFKNESGATAAPSNLIRSIYLDFENYDAMLTQLETMSKQQDKYKSSP